MDKKEYVLKTIKPQFCYAKNKIAQFNFGGENDEVQKYTDGTNAGSIETDSTTSR